MYTCRLTIYLVGRPGHAFEVIKKLPALESFSHSFIESDEADAHLSAEADMILADLAHMDIPDALQVLFSNRKKEADVILLTDKKQMPVLCADPAFSEITDIWISPMSDEELRFRFLRWQQTCKMSRDFWQTSQYLEAAINNTPNMIWYKDKDGVHEKVNDSFCRTVNKTKQQVEGQRHAYIWDVEEDDPACIQSEHQVMSTRQTLVSGETIKTGDGMRMLTTYKSPLYDLDGSVMGTVGIGIDVTQERTYEQEIIKKNQTLETIFSNIECGVIAHNLDGSQIFNINTMALKILGYEDREELERDGFHLIAATVIEEDKEDLLKSIKTLTKPGDYVNVEYRVRHNDGKLLHVMGSIKLLEKNGELFYQRFLLDITAQKQQERENERRHMGLVQALSIDFSLIWFVDSETGLITPIRSDGTGPNKYFDSARPLWDNMEAYIQEQVYEDDREMLRQAVSLESLKKNLAETKTYCVNYRKYKDGQIEYFQMKVVRDKTESGMRGIVLGFRSVDTEIRREMEQNALLETALSQAKKASKAKSIFLSNMSHDIRTPMNAIVGFTDLAITHIDSTEQVSEYLKKIKISSNHLLGLINDVLDMSHIESGKVHLEDKPCNLSEILNGLRNILQANVQAKNLTLEIDTVDLLHTNIYCDKVRLNQVLLNLLSNSVKYTEAGGMINLRLQEKTGAPEGYGCYEFSIKDNGMGMSREFVERIFEPFERERNSTISKIQGTGLGMAITKNIVDLMNGSIHVESEQGVGTEFTVSFTFRLSSGAEFEATATEGTANGKASAGDVTVQRTGRLLLAEDVEMNQEIAKALLEGVGFTVDIAENGRIAADMVEQSEPGYYRAVLMDIQMTEMNGYEATRRIRSFKNPELASIPIIAMTANAFAEDREEALKSGMNGHVTKPLDVQVLLETLDKII